MNADGCVLTFKERRDLLNFMPELFLALGDQNVSIKPTRKGVGAGGCLSHPCTGVFFPIVPHPCPHRSRYLQGVPLHLKQVLVQLASKSTALVAKGLAMQQLTQVTDLAPVDVDDGEY